MLKNILRQILIISSIFLLIPMLSKSFAQQIEFGIRAGLNQSRKENTELHLYEFYILTDFPLDLTKDRPSDLELKLESTMGLLNDAYANSVLFSLGPVAKLNIYDNKIIVTGGISPSFMTKHTFKNLELGGCFNFISHIALMFSPIDDVNFGYRFEHISNSGFYENNPGINMHFLDIRYNKKN